METSNSASDRGPVLSNVHVSIVKPARASEHPASFDPTFYDLVNIDGILPVLFAYRIENTDEAFAELTRAMKKSLAEVLVDQYPFAGRWVRTMDAKMRRLECNDAGVPFIEAFLDEDMERVVDFGDFQPVRCLTGFDVVGFDFDKFYQNSAPDFVSLFVQVTRFKCGGVTLVSNLNHMTADGKGFFNFMKAWGEIARNGKSTIVPDHRRWQSWSYEASIPGFLEANNGIEGVTRLTSEVARIYPNGDRGEMFKPPPSRMVPLSVRSFHVRKDLVEKTKKEVAAVNDGNFVTTLDCISAHIGKHWAQLAKSNHRPEHIRVIVDGRARFYEEKLSSDFSANCLSSVVIPPPQQEESLITWARVVHKCVGSVNHTNWRGHGARGPNDFARDPGFVVSSWFRFPMYEVDFGFGKPLFCSYAAGYNFFPSGACTVLPPVPQYSKSIATAIIASSKETLEGFLSHSDFLSFFLEEPEDVNQHA